MQVRNLSLGKWKQITEENGFYLPTANPKFIEIVKKSYKLKSLQYIIYDKEKPILGIVIYFKNKNIVHPSQYFYTPVWENSCSKLIIQDAYVCLIKELKSHFRNIHFRFPPEIFDIRPFIANNFRHNVNYTYIKKLSELEFSSKILSRNRKALDAGIVFTWEYNEEILNQNIRSLYNLGYCKSYVNPIKEMFDKLYKEGLVTGVAASINNVIVGSAIILLDNKNLNAMNLLITSEKQNYNTGLHTALYLNIFNKLKNEGYIINDLYGANTLGIGNFKGNFGGELKPHYTLKYNYFRNKLVTIILNSLKVILGKRG